MVERVRTRLIAAALVDMDAEFIQQAVDYMSVGKKDIVRLIVVNNICVGIDTTNTPIRVMENPQLLLSDQRIAPPSPRQQRAKMAKRTGRAARHPGIDTITKDVVLNVFNESHDGSTNAQTIGDRLNAPPMSPLRSKITRVLAALVAEKIVTMSGKRSQAVYKLRRKPVQPQAPQAPAKAPAKAKQAPQAKAAPTTQAPKMRRMTGRGPVITEDTVLTQLRKGPEMLSMDISDNLNIDRKDGKSRVKVSTILNILLKKDVIEIVGKSRGIMPIYKMKPGEPAAFEESTESPEEAQAEA